MKRVALKFCGGCDPDYDRVEYWEKVRSAAGDRIKWLRVDDEGIEVALLINGCARACLENDLEHVPIRYTISIKDDTINPEQLIANLL